MFPENEYYDFGSEDNQDNQCSYYDLYIFEPENLFDLNSFCMNNENHKDEDTRNLENSVQNVETGTSLEEDTTSQDDKNNINDEDAKQSENANLQGKSSNTTTHQKKSIFGAQDLVSKNRFIDKVTMQKVIELINEYYPVFIEEKKKFDKIYVKRIDPFLVKYLGLKKMTREEFRCIALYFENRANKKHEIIKCLQDHKNEIMNSDVFKGFKYPDHLKINP